MAESFPEPGEYQVYVLDITTENNNHFDGTSSAEGTYTVELGVEPPISNEHPGIAELAHLLGGSVSGHTVKAMRGELGNGCSNPRVYGEEGVVRQSPEVKSHWGSVVAVDVKMNGVPRFDPSGIPGYNPGDRTDQQYEQARKTWLAARDQSVWRTADALTGVVGDALNRHVKPDANARHLKRLGKVSIARPDRTPED